MSRTYISSGFFNEQQVQWVVEIEKTLDALKMPYFSPRAYVTDLSTKDLGIRAYRAKKILEMNVNEINSANCIVVNVDSLPYDIGTMWELGYAVGLAKKGRKIQIDLVSKVESRILLFKKIVENLLESEPKVVEGYYLLTASNMIDFEASKFINNWTMMNAELPEDLSSYTVGEYTVFLIDDHPFQSYILMGFMYAMELYYMTASCKGFGSNVMISASSSGHIMLNGVLDGSKLGGKLE